MIKRHYLEHYYDQIIVNCSLDHTEINNYYVFKVF